MILIITYYYHDSNYFKYILNIYVLNIYILKMLINLILINFNI